MIDSARAFNHLVITIGRVMYCRYLINKSIRTFAYCIYITQTDCLDRRLITPMVCLIVYYMGQCTRCARYFCTYPCTQIPLINVHDEVSKNASAPKLGLSIYLQPYFVYASSEGSGESEYLRLRCSPMQTVPASRAHVVPMGGSRGGGGDRGSGPPGKSQKYKVSLQYWSGSPEKPRYYQASIQF